jgi:hypothetical protein
MDNNLIYLDGKVTGSSGYMAVFSGSNAVSKSLIYQTGSQIGINANTDITGSLIVTGDILGKVTSSAILINGNSANSFTVYGVPNNATPFRVSTQEDAVGVFIEAATDIISSVTITGSLGITSNISSSTANIATLTVPGNIINDGLVSCSIAISGNSGARSFTVSLTKNNGTALTNQRQVVHWWTSGTQYGAASAIASNSYAIVSGSNIVPISNSGSINHAVTDTSGKFAVKLSNDTSSPLANPVYFHITVQGAVFVANSTVDTNSSPPV